MSKKNNTKPTELDPARLERSNELDDDLEDVQINDSGVEENDSDNDKKVKDKRKKEDGDEEGSDNDGDKEGDKRDDKEKRVKKETRDKEEASENNDDASDSDNDEDSQGKSDNNSKKKADKPKKHRADEDDDNDEDGNNPFYADAPPKKDDTKENKNYGVLEGMDPETGNYIRPSNLELNTNANKKTKKPDKEEEDDKQPPKTRMGRRKREKKGLRRSRSLSRRVLDTVSNKSRTDDEDSDDEAQNAGNCLFGNQIRFTIMLISTLCLASILSNILTFNFTFICMAGEKPLGYQNMTAEQQYLSGYKPHLDYTSGQRSALFMSVAIGSLVAVFPMTIALNKYGSRVTFGALGLISAVATFLVPLSANTSFWAMLIMRGIQGVGFSACLPVMGSITSHWSTLKQNGIFIAILSSFLQIAPIFTMPISGELCMSSLGWESVYYLHGTVCVVLFTIFILYHRNSPHKHPMMNRTEIVKVYFGKGSIYSGPGKQKSKQSKKVPVKAIYSDIHIWAILVAAFGNFFGTQLSLQFIPTYLNKVLFLPVEQTGVVSAISPVIMFFIKLVAGQSSDRITFISDEWKLRIYNCLSCGMMGVFFIILASLDPRTNESLCLVVLITATCILGFNSGGFFKSSQMVSRQHSHFTLANIAFENCVCMLLVPLLNEVVAPENEPADWAIVLWIHGIILLSTNAFFCVFCSAKPAPWTLDTWQNRQSKKHRRSMKKSSIQPVDDPKNNDNNV